MVSLFQPTGARIWVRDQSIPELDIAVVKEWRGRSIGTTLLKELISTARTRGCSGLSLSVSAANPAQRLYQRCAFQSGRSRLFMDHARAVALTGNTPSEEQDV